MSDLQEVLKALEHLQPDAFDDAARFQIKEAARRLVARLETPFEKAWALAFEHPVLFAAIQVLIDTGLWCAWVKVGAGPMTVQDLANLDGKIEINLLRRLLRHLAAFSIVSEDDIETYSLNHFSKALGAENDLIRQALQMGTDTSLDSAKNLPAFLSRTQYREPLDSVQSNFANAKGSSFFAYCKEVPGAGQSFIGLMQGLATHKMAWTEVYDTQELLRVECKAGVPILVDVGGAHGVDIERFRSEHPDLPAGSLVMQDLAAVVDMAELHASITGMTHDFFEPQPCKGSRAYFMHAVPHDWPDQDCLKIFRNLVPAMTPGYSKLLIYEVVLPNRDASGMMTTLDTQLMSLCSAFERTEAMWARLLEEAGLKIVKIWKHPRAVESVIEAELA